jgi:hypothetical protein
MNRIIAPGPAGMVIALLPNPAVARDKLQPIGSTKSGPNRDSEEVHQRNSTPKEN